METAISVTYMQVLIWKRILYTDIEGRTNHGVVHLATIPDGLYTIDFTALQLQVLLVTM